MDVDLEGITPNWEFLPPGVRDLFESAAGTALMIGLAICVIGFVVAGVRLLSGPSTVVPGLCGMERRCDLDHGAG